MSQFSDYIVYADESGHAAPDPDPNFPCFVLAFCIFEKKYYCEKLAPALQKLKFRYFGHDMAIMHERDIRKALGPFNILIDKKTRNEFMSDLTSLMESTEFGVLPYTILKKGQHLPEDNLYHIAACQCLASLYEKLKDLNQLDYPTHVIFEQRGNKEDKQLELEFRRICSGNNQQEVPYPFIPIFASKKANSSGLQFADLVARPIGINALRPEQANRAYEIIKQKDLKPNLTQSELDINS